MATAGPSQQPIDKKDDGKKNRPRPPLPPPHVLEKLVPDSPVFSDLIKLEQKLDWTLLRRKAEVNDALGRPLKISRTLRVFISNTAHDQDWQKEADAATNVDAETGKGIPGWVLRIEGRLLDVGYDKGALTQSGNVRIDKTRRKFSTFLKTAIVEFDNREAPTFPEGNIVEWHPSSNAPLDGFEVSRRGDANVTCRIILHIAHSPDRFKILHPLSDVITMREGTRAEIMTSVWKLVKVAGAQDKEDGSMIRPVGGLSKVIPPEGIPFHQLPEVVSRFLAHPDPVIIPYTLSVDRDFQTDPKCYDIPVEIEDPLKSKMATILQSFEGQEGQQIVDLEDKVGELAYFARDLKQKRDFLEAFAYVSGRPSSRRTNPQAFIHDWLAAQARDMDEMLGYQIGTTGNGGSVKEEDLRRSDLFQMPWINEAISVHEAGRMESQRRQRHA